MPSSPRVPTRRPRAFGGSERAQGRRPRGHVADRQGAVAGHRHPRGWRPQIARARLARSAPRGAGSRACRGRARRRGVRSVAGPEDPSHTDGVEVVAGKATIVAETVIVATGEPGTLFSALARHFAEAETYVALTPPLGGGRAAHGRDTRRDRRGSIAPPAPPVLDGRRSHPLVRRRSASRGGTPAQGGPGSAHGAVDARAVTGAARDLGHATRYGWHAPWSRAHDDLPFIGTHRNYPHHLFALGLGTNLTAAFLASRILVRAVQGTSEKSDEYFGFGRLAARR